MRSSRSAGAASTRGRLASRDGPATVFARPHGAAEVTGMMRLGYDGLDVTRAESRLRGGRAIEPHL